MRVNDQQARGTRSRAPFGVLLLVGVLASFGTPAAADELPLGRLVWENGDVLPGTMTAATPTSIEWRSPVFAAPFSLDVEHLKSAHFPAGNALVAHDEPLSFQSTGGDVIHGKLLDVTDEAFIIDSGRHGRLSLRRSAIRSFGRVDPRVLERKERATTSGWRSLSTTQTVSQWQANRAGKLTTKIIGAMLGGDFKLPDVSELEIALSWKERPAFAIVFASVKAMRFGGDLVALEAADDQLLLKGPDKGSSQHLADLPERARSLRLRVIWDQTAQRLSIYSSDGKLLGRTSVSRRTGTGLYITNRGPDLTVDRLRMRPSKGTLGREPGSGEAYFRTFDGSNFSGRLVAFDRSNGSIAAEDSRGVRRTIASDNLVGVHFTNRAASADEATSVMVRYYDGTVLRGKVSSIDGSALKMVTPLCDQPITSKLTGIREMVFLSARHTPPKGTTDVLEVGGGVLTGVLHGAVAPAVGEADVIGWRPVGSKNASRLTGDYPVRIVRRSVGGKDAPEGVPRTDVLYLENGDIIPCRFQMLDAQRAVVDCDMGQKADIPLERIKAIEFNSETAVPVIGFGGDQWEIKATEEGAVKLVDGKAAFSGRATLSHDNLLQGDDLQFDVQWNPRTQCVVTISLHAREGRVAAKNTLLLYFLQGRLLVRGPQGRAFVGQQVLREKQNEKCEAKVRISTSGKKVAVYVDDAELITYPLPERDQLGRGLLFSVQPVAVRRVRVVDANGRVRQVVQDQDGQAELLTLSNLVVSRVGNAMRFLNVRDEHLESVLTVPRSRKKNPSSHLLVAQNGDLLRGQLVGMTDDVIHFKSRLETLPIDRSRVDAIIWLKEPQGQPPEDDQPAAPAGTRDETRVQAVLSSGARVSFALQEMTDEFLEGEHPLLGKCRVAANEVLELQVGGQVRPSPSAKAYSEWQLTFAKEPFPDSGAAGAAGDLPGFGVESPLVGTAAEDFKVDLLDGRRFRLSDHAGKVVVLDFWTTWCGPCARALPEIINAVEQFPRDQVLLVAVNQQETEKAIRDYLAAREWNLTVAVDRDGRVGRQFQVEAIPQTVIIGRDGKIERLHVGAHPDLQTELTAALEELLAPAGEMQDQG